MQYDTKTLTQNSLDRMNIEFLIVQLSRMNQEGFVPDEVIIQRMYDWIIDNNDEQLKAQMRLYKLI